ncbi:5-(carboxyamino)imidazole ribonucleotide synthase [Altererythrobacter sp. B11]|uniref:5-(carboxyamino)imidazole ribonucleotide synthase n=1 Tax=Altererythrobacter sp. B11 TaxID=2060312 RepID=UPI000DC6E8B8|nr:5-(carboxyamino)imidazole ribonucleotide synthase [Altererythrobacter sp. B11]BBC71371.1 5-(carboxyamino)imidazole ribonucleotide synthase [Altererythrobacter sp. B11]
MIPTGATIGILGGGQLGRMIAMAAAQLGYRCHVFAPEKDSVAAEVSADFTCASWHDQAALSGFAQDCAVITYEFENVPVAPLAAIPDGRLISGRRALEVAQDRLAEKRFVAELGGRPAPYAAVDGGAADGEAELREAVERVGLPGILKTRRDGYDGKGQWRVASLREIDGLRIPRSGLVFEGLVRFEAEFSVILARRADGVIAFWDSAQNVHQGGILARSFLPPSQAVLDQVDEARALSRKVADALGYVGVMALEFFATADGPVFNEMAPRVHNSGHWTIEGAVTSQFENHVRAICGLPLGDTSTVGGQVEMRNLIGDEAADVAGLLGDPQAHLHLYGKAEARPGRKMGHVTRIG